jgi:hypothetical protein
MVIMYFGKLLEFWGFWSIVFETMQNDFPTVFGEPFYSGKNIDYTAIISGKWHIKTYDMDSFFQFAK